MWRGLNLHRKIARGYCTVTLHLRMGVGMGIGSEKCVMR